MKVALSIVAAAALCAAPAASLNVRRGLAPPLDVDDPAADTAKQAMDTSGSLTHTVGEQHTVIPNENVPAGSHVPQMVDRGTFAARKFENRLRALHNGTEHYVPAVVPEGTLTGIVPPEKEPKRMPHEMPNMVPSGHFARVAQQMRTQKMSKMFGDDRSQKQGLCDVLGTVVEMGRFVYEAEYTSANGVEKAGEAILKMHDIVCPYLRHRFPDATSCCNMPACEAMAERIKKLSSPEFIGEVKTPRQKCENKPGRKVNYALVAALTGPNMLFGTDFCDDVYKTPPSCDKTAVGRATLAGMKNVPGHSIDTEENVVEMEKAAEASVLQKEHLSWVHHQIQPVEDQPDDETVDPAVNSTEVYASRRAKVQAQVEKEEAEEAAEAERGAAGEDAEDAAAAASAN